MISIMVLAGQVSHPVCAQGPGPGSPPNHVLDEHGAIIRGDTSQRELALVFTGDEFADGAGFITEVLARHHIKASFFLTGRFFANPDFSEWIREAKNDGHYLGAHSDQHLLYCDWTRRDSLLVTEEQFRADLLANYGRMARFGIDRADAPYFIPPYEWYNIEIARWTSALGFKLINYSPGTRSVADYTYPGMGARYWSSDKIFASILEHERRDRNGLNGFILLLHVGTDPRRTDKFYHRLDELLTTLQERGYRFVNLHRLLGAAP